MVRINSFLKKRSRELLQIGFFLTPALLVLFVYRILPLFWNLALSFMHWAPGQPYEFAGLFHYEEMFIYDDTFREVGESKFIDIRLYFQNQNRVHTEPIVIEPAL